MSYLRLCAYLGAWKGGRKAARDLTRLAKGWLGGRRLHIKTRLFARVFLDFPFSLQRALLDSALLLYAHAVRHSAGLMRRRGCCLRFRGAERDSFDMVP